VAHVSGDRAVARFINSLGISRIWIAWLKLGLRLATA
jgi:hypothetical protein